MSANAQKLNNENPFQAFWNLGYRRLHPIVPPDGRISDDSRMARALGGPSDPRGKAPAYLGADGFWWGIDFPKFTTDPSMFPIWVEWGAGVGLRTGDGLAALDSDTLDPALAEIVWSAWCEMFPGVWPRRYGNRPKFAVLFRTPEGETVRFKFVRFPGLNNKPERVELLTGGKQVVVSGTHPKTRRPYLWEPPPVPFDELPVISGKAIADFFNVLHDRIPGCTSPTEEGASDGPVPEQKSLTAPLEVVRRAVAALPNTSETFPTRNSYLQVGYSIKAALPDHKAEALELFQEWASRWEGNLNAPDGNDPDTVEKDWGRLKGPFRIGAPWLMEQAEVLSSGAFSRAADYWFTKVEDTAPESWVVGAPQTAKPPFELLSVSDAERLALETDSEPLVDNLLDQGAMSVLYGESNAGKSFIAFDLAYCVSLPKPWAGRSVAHKKVVYVAAEGGKGVHKRIAGLSKTHGESADFKYIRDQVDLLDPQADCDRLIAAIRNFGDVGLVVIDTLSRALAGGDENASTDMGAFVKNADYVRLALDCHLLIVHHTGKDRAKGARGHSLLRAATDTELEVAENTVSVTKQRDMEFSDSIGFELENIRLGVGANGKPIDTARVVFTEPQRPGAPSDGERPILEAIHALETGASGHPTPKEIHAWLSGHGHVVSDSWVRNTLGRLCAKLLIARERNRYRTNRLHASAVFTDIMSNDVFS